MSVETFWLFVVVPTGVVVAALFVFVTLFRESQERRAEMTRLNMEARDREARIVAPVRTRSHHHRRNVQRPNGLRGVLSRLRRRLLHPH